MSEDPVTYASEMHARRLRTLAVLHFPFNWQPQHHGCISHYYNCLLFIIIPPVKDVHVMLKKIECERRVWSTKLIQRMTKRHLYLSMK